MNPLTHAGGSAFNRVMTVQEPLAAVLDPPAFTLRRPAPGVAAAPLVFASPH